MLAHDALLDDAAIACFGEEVIFHADTGNVPARAIYRAPWEGTALGGIIVERADPSIDMRLADWQALDMQADDEVTVRGVRYTILEYPADDGGMVHISLAKYQA